MAIKINDKRGENKPREVCRVCGSEDVHTQDYNNPSMDCIEHLRGVIADAKCPKCDVTKTEWDKVQEQADVFLVRIEKREKELEALLKEYREKVK